MPPTLTTLRDAGGLERHRHTGPRGLQDLQADNGAAAGVRAACQRFTVYGADKLRNVLRFKYLGSVMLHDDNTIPAMQRNLKLGRATLGRVFKMLTPQEVPASIVGMFYQAVVAAVLLYSSESWVLSPSALKVIEGFQVEAA